MSAAFRVIREAAGVWWRAWLSLSALNLAWLLCWLTVVLGPPATLSLYRAARTLAQGRDLYLGELLAAARQDFLRSWLWFSANALVAFGLWFSAQVYLGLGRPGWLLAPLLLVALWLTLQFYALPFFVVQEAPSLRRAWRNALLTALASPLYTAVLMGFSALLLYLSAQLVFPLFLGAPCLLAVLGTCAVLERLATFGVKPSAGATSPPPR